MLQMLLESYTPGSYKSLKRVICGGEALTSDLMDHFFNKLEAEFYNIYGPTETTIGATYWKCKPGYQGNTVPIGRPVTNTKTYILDANLNPVSVGVTGELYIAGVSLARGYLNRADLTAEKFVPDPFSFDPGERLYRTGDVARYLPDGSIEFLGRLDHQVKVRGFRIELSEIEGVLREQANVRDAAVVVREDAPGNKRLVAYVASSEKSADSTDELRRFLKERLPEYMMPAQIIFMDGLPLTANGKVDRKALASPEITEAAETSYVEPRSLIEKEVAAIWSEVLTVERVGIYDNFFDLGGDSLLATRVVRRLGEKLQMDIPLLLLFKHSTVAGLTEAVVGKIPLEPDNAMKDLGKLTSLRQVLTELEQLSKKD